MQCECCKKEKPDARERINPYAADVHNRIEMIVICDDCEKEYKNDI